MGVKKGDEAMPNRAKDLLERNKELAHKLHLEVIQKYNLDLAEEIIAPDCIFHRVVSTPKDARGPEVARLMAKFDRELFPNGVKFDHPHTIAEGDKVVIYWVSKGVHKSGVYVEVPGIDIFRVKNGKIAEAWIMWDRLSLQEKIQAGSKS